MITLYGGGQNFGLPEVSPYVTKTEVQLKMAGLPYRKQRATPLDAPKGKMPWIEDDGELIADSHFIRLHIERKYGVDLDEGLDDLRRAEAWTVERMIEDHLNWALVRFRWGYGDNFARGPAHFVDGAPEHMRPQLREDLLASFWNKARGHGIGLHTDEEALQLGARSLGALSILLGDRLYLLGGSPCGTDAAMFGCLAGILTPFFDSPLRARAEALPNLVGYVERMMLRFYPDFEWAAAQEAVAA